MPTAKKTRKPSKPPAATKKRAPARKTAPARKNAQPASSRKSAPARARKKKSALRVGCVYLMTRDMSRSIAFYGEGLGLEVVVRYGDDWAELDGGDVRLGLHPTDEPLKAGGGGATVSFYVTDLDAAVRRVTAAGGEVGGIHTTPRGRMAMALDTEGNQLHFTEFDPTWVRRAKYPLQNWARRR
jgi:predicted enzyme related to lactoylglutathione lyase